jgi:endonuclease/exonuclease/phosphatase family metal-dependent hydrolase
MLLILLTALVGGCGSSSTSSVDIPEEFITWEDLELGSPETFDIMTWNLKQFPYNNTVTVTYLAGALEKLDVDVVALQEIGSATHLAAAIADLDGWESYKSTDSYGISLAYLWNTATVTLSDDIYEIYTDDGTAFPRPPLIMECEWNGVPLTIINNHLKAMGTAEDIYRRKLACKKLDEYIEGNLPDERVIMLGDLNDFLTDSPDENVFQVFLDDTTNYLFTDMAIAEGPQSSWSWKLSSHLDHIMITDELFDDFAGAQTVVRTMRLDQYLERGFSEYEKNLSDHLPVAMKIKLTPDAPITPPIEQPDTGAFIGLDFGEDETFDVMTWNLKEFPLSSSSTVGYVAEAILDLDVDVVALQEIDSAASFTALLNSLPGWSGERETSAYYDVNLAYVWDSATVTVDRVFEIYTGDSDAFPRSPQVMECTWKGTDLVIINNHLKAGTDWDDQRRRKAGCTLLDSYIATNLANARVLVVGDLNDRLTDGSSDNVFKVFLDKPAQYRFADMGIAQGPSSAWSWDLSSHLDHVLISNELFTDFDRSAADIQTLRVDQYMQNGYSIYKSKISDHWPVAIKLPLQAD